MTILVNIGTRDRIMQITDRRFTYVSAGGNKTFDDEKNKAIVFHTPNARCLVGCVGLGEINGKRTDIMAAQILRKFCSVPLRGPEFFDNIAAHLTTEFRSLAIEKARRWMLDSDIVFMGFLSEKYLFRARISNHAHGSNADSEAGCFIATETDCTNTIPEKTTRRLRKRPGLICEVVGSAEDLFINLHKDTLAALRRKRFFTKNPPTVVADAVVELIRQLADHPSANGLVGKSCLVNIIPRSVDGEHNFKYYSKDDEVVSYGPTIVMRGSVLSDFKTSPL